VEDYNMDLLAAIKSRRSIRAFKPEPVSEDILSKLLEIAVRAPSSVNSQPWEFFVVRGTMLRDLKEANLKEYRLGKKPAPELPVGETRGGAPALEGVFKERSVKLAKQIFGILGISKGDKKGLVEYMEGMLQFYDAPAVIIIVNDKRLVGSWPVLDTGFMAENIALAAQEYGLGTCIMRAIVDYPETLRRVVNIPESKRIIVGVAIGYPDWDHPINQLKTDREKIENMVTLLE
jgi:nitroreductase